MKILRTLVLCVAVLAAFGCNSEKKESAETTSDTAVAEKAAEPDFITVQHILIGFTGSVPGKSITRTQEEAATLAADILKRAQDGEDFDTLVKEFTDDAHPGIYKMANRGVAADMANKVFARDGMVPAFGDVGFPLAVGEIGMAEYSQQTSPYGWHIIKRLL